MIKVAVFNNLGQKKEDLTVKVADRYLKLNENLISQVLHVEQNRITAKSGETKTKGEVRGGGKKPYKQKGTGRARAGSSRSPLWRGGGITFGPSGVSKILSINSKMKKLAFLQLLAKLLENKSIVVLENIDLKDKKTKTASGLIEKIAPGERAILAVAKDEIESLLPFRNLGSVENLLDSSILISDLLKKRKFIYTDRAFASLKTRLEND